MSFEQSVRKCGEIGTVQDLYSFHLIQMLMLCWMMISLFTMLDKQPTDACFISPKHLSQVIRAAAGSEASTRQSDQIAVFDVVKKTKCLGEIKHASVGCLSSIVSKLIIIQQCSNKQQAHLTPLNPSVRPSVRLFVCLSVCLQGNS